MVKNNESELIFQHRKDAEKALVDLETQIPPEGTNIPWEEIKQVRTKHIENFLESLRVQQEEYEHFK